MKILAIDTSCDETSVAITDDLNVLSNVVSSQIRYHKKYGGVVPFLAQRLHKERIDSVIEVALQRAKAGWDEIDAVAVTYGPGLAPALEVGLSKAKELAVTHDKPLYGVNHMAGHLAAGFIQVGSSPAPQVVYPHMALLLSGGHSELILIPKWGNYTILGETLDDALGEAYDKVSKMLGLGYPGGAVVAKLAESGYPLAYDLPIPMQNHKGYDLSYSGLKNAVRLLIEQLDKDNNLSVKTLSDLCASFERVAQASVLQKAEKALIDYPEVKMLVLGGGVISNKVLRKKIRSLAKEYKVRVVVPSSKKLCTDNAAMIAAAAFLNIQAGTQPSDLGKLDRKPGLTIDDPAI